MTPHIALCIGHSRHINGRREGGAVSHDGKMNEWSYNLPLALEIRDELKKSGIRAIMLSDYEGTSYGAAQRWLAARLKQLDVSLALELHFNSADSPTAAGHEWLHWHSSTKGKTLATHIHNAVSSAFPELKARGIKSKSSGDRGAEFLKLTHCPAVIAEPGFGSSPKDWATLQTRRPDLARAIAAGLIASLP